MTVDDYFKLGKTIFPLIARLFIDFRIWILLVAPFALLFATMRFYFGDKQYMDIAKSKEFLIPSALLLIAWFISYHFLYSPKPVPKDDNIYLTVASFGNTQEAVFLREQVELELAKTLGLFENVTLLRNAIRESISDTSQAEKLAKARGLHMVAFGRTDKLNDGKFRIRTTLLQVNSFKGIQLGRFDWEQQDDLSDLQGLRRVAKDIAIKTLRTCDQNFNLEFQARHNRASFNTVLYGSYEATFNLGSNITQKFLLGNKSENMTFLEGSISNEGEPVISGRLYDSDGEEYVSISGEEIIFSDESMFSLVKKGSSFTIFDRYNRKILEYIVEDSKSAFIDRYLRAQKRSNRETMQELQVRAQFKIPEIDNSQGARETLNRFGKIVTIRGEIYREDGLLGLILSNEQLYQYAIPSLQF